MLVATSPVRSILGIIAGRNLSTHVISCAFEKTNHPEERRLVKNKLWIAGLVVVMTLMGCSTVPERGAARAGYSRVDSGAARDINLSDAKSLKAVLYAQYDEWKGTPYRIGGMSKESVDCSGFIHITFKSKLGVILPRSTDLQVALGINVDRDELRPGDLVFFKTGKVTRHVGVYLEKDRFLHASTSQGVVISDLNNAYWKSAYWKARRLEM